MTDHCSWDLVTFGLVACTLHVLELQMNHSLRGVNTYLAIHPPALQPKLVLFQGKSTFYVAENPDLYRC